MSGASSFARALRQQRQSLGLTQAELAERAGLSERAISDLERGLKTPHRATARLLADALGLDTEEAKQFTQLRRAHDSLTSRARHNLPEPLTSFIGREQPIADIRRVLQPRALDETGRRMVTLTGAGGCGKTRLGLEVARELVDGFADGVWFVDLAPISDARVVPQTVLAVVGGQESAGQEPLATLLRYVRGRTLLLVLDNCEHLVQPCAEIAVALLQSTTDLRILATSRELLRVPGETAWRVPSLDVPEALRLFVERLRLLQPEFSLSATTTPAVEEICIRLDGIPLAIELAAARCAALSIHEIAARLDDRFRLLTSGSRVALPRHRTLQATIDWSHDLLSATERTLFRRLSVFAGGWTLEAAEDVCAGHPLPSGETADLLTRLVEQSLVGVHEQHGRTRYRFLETVRVYAAERLSDTGEGDTVRLRHRQWCLTFAERAADELGRRDQVEWVERIAAELDNVRAALETCRTDDNGAAVELRLAAAIGQFWRMQLPSEGRRRLGEAISRVDERPSSPRAAALVWLASIEMLFGDPSAGRALAQQALSDARAVGDMGRAAYALRQLALATADRDAATRIALLEEGLRVARSAGADSEAAAQLAFLAEAAAEAADFSRVRALLDEAEPLARAAGDAWNGVQPLAQLGWLAVTDGRLTDAERYFQEAFDLADGIGYVAAAAMSMVGLGQVALRRGGVDKARQLHRQALLIQRESGGAYLASGLLYLAAVEEADGQHERAQRLVGASDAWHAARGGAAGVWLPWTHGPLRRGLVAVPPPPTDRALATARAEGQAMALDEAVSMALSDEVAEGNRAAIRLSGGAR